MQTQFYKRSLPQGASRSMSPYLLANTFQVDFYDLYRNIMEQKDKEKEERKEKLK